jgi:hypothetical protein
MATITPESIAPDGGLRLADIDPEVEHYASGSDRFVVKFTLKGTDLLELQNVLAPRWYRTIWRYPASARHVRSDSRSQRSRSSSWPGRQCSSSPSRGERVSGCGSRSPINTS